jgi:hypothetical protein
MIELIATLLLFGYLPGAAMMRVPVAGRQRREQLSADERAFWAVVLSTSWSLGVAFAMALLHVYTSQRLLAANACLVLVVGIVWRQRLRYDRPAAPTRWALLPLAIGVGALWLYQPPSEYIIGGKDPGVYVNAGVQIAQGGSIVFRDPTAAGLPVAMRPLFFPQHMEQPYYSPRFMGFFLLDPDAGTVVDQFPHLYPVAIAIGYGTSGLLGVREVSVFAAVVGVLALYFLAARLGGRIAGAVAASLMAINIIEVWYARYPNSEMLTQALGVAALLAVARAHVDEDPFFAPVAAVLLGLLPFARFDAILIVGLAATGPVLQWIGGDRFRWRFIVPLAALVVAFAAYFLTIVAPYAKLPRIWFGVHQTEIMVGLPALVLALFGIRWVLARLPSRRVLLYWTPRALLVTTLAMAFYAWFLRQPGGALAAHDAYAFRAFGWYVDPRVLVLAAIGLSIVMTTRFWLDPSTFVVFIGMSTFVFNRLRIVPEHFWAARRFVPIILPGVCLAIAFALTPAATRGASVARRLTGSARHVVRLVLFALVAWSFWSATSAIRRHVEFGGIEGKIARIASRFGSQDLLVVESRNASDVHVLGLPLAYIWDKPVLVLNTPKPDPLLFAEFIRWARQRYQSVYFLGGGGTDLLSREVSVEPVGSERFQVPEYESLTNAYPTHVRRKEFDFGIYRFVDPAALPDDIAFDVGAMDDLHVVRFNAKERDARGTFRWTRGQSYLSLLGLDATRRELVIRMNNGNRPPQAAPATVEAFFGETSLGKVAVGPADRGYVFDIPETLASEASRNVGASTIRLISSTFSPRALTGADDDRELGVKVDRVELRRVAVTPN